jgi:hypothetical protein
VILSLQLRYVGRLFELLAELRFGFPQFGDDGRYFLVNRTTGYF